MRRHWFYGQFRAGGATTPVPGHDAHDHFLDNPDQRAANPRLAAGSGSLDISVDRAADHVSAGRAGVASCLADRSFHWFDDRDDLWPGLALCPDLPGRDSYVRQEADAAGNSEMDTLFMKWRDS